MIQRKEENKMIENLAELEVSTSDDAVCPSCGLTYSEDNYIISMMFGYVVMSVTSGLT